MKVIYKAINGGGYVAAVVTKNGDRVQKPENYNSIWALYDLAARFGAVLEKH